jgi:uncharacterized membrane protein YqjE
MADVSEHREARERPTPELMRELSDQATTLIRKEIELAKVEFDVKRKKAMAGAGMFGGAGLFGLFAFGALTACLILVLATFLSAWLAALIVAVVYGAIAGVLALRGKKQVAQATPPVPEQAVDSTKEDLEWIKTRAKSGRNN